MRQPSARQPSARQSSARLRRARAAVLAGVLAMAVGGCGDDDNDETPDVPGLVDEADIETFEPTDDTFGMPTVEPDQNS